MHLSYTSFCNGRFWTANKEHSELMCECAFQALSTIVWDNGFAEWGRTAFMVNEKVPWGRMGEVLSMKWKSVCGADLTEDQLYSLACKALRYPPIQRNLWRTWPDFFFCSGTTICTGTTTTTPWYLGSTFARNFYPTEHLHFGNGSIEPWT